MIICVNRMNILEYKFRSYPACINSFSFQQKVKESQELRRTQISNKIVKVTYCKIYHNAIYKMQLCHIHLCSINTVKRPLMFVKPPVLRARVYNE